MVRRRSELVPADLDQTIRWVSSVVGPLPAHRRELRRRAEAAAAKWGPSSVELLAARMHGEYTPPDTAPAHLHRLGAWIEARLYAIFEIFECLGEAALPVLRRIAHGEYDWSQGNAIEILCRLAARGVERDAIGKEIAELLPEVRSEAVEYAMGPLLVLARADHALREFLDRYASFEEPAVIDAEGDVVIRGLEGGRRFERKVRRLDEAAALLRDVHASDRTSLAAALFELWQRQRRPERAGAETAVLLRERWREQLASFVAGEQEGEDDYERSAPWIRLAELGALLPLEAADVATLRIAAQRAPLARQSAAWKRLDRNHDREAKNAR